MLVVELADVDRISLAELGPELLLLASAVIGDDRVRRIENRLRRAVVLLELDDLGIGELLLEAEDVVDIGAAKAVDRLIRVADNREVAAFSGKQLEPAVLNRIGVLVLVHEDLTERLLVGAAHLREQLEHVHGAGEQVVEVHRVHAVQLALVARIDIGDGALEERADQL